jgi:hypothetical protein
LQIIHTDICGPIDPKAHDEKRYFMTMLDDYRRFCKIYLLETKSVPEVFSYIKEYITEAEAHFNLKTSKIRCDNGKEYKNKLLIDGARKKRNLFGFYNTTHSTT